MASRKSERRPPAKTGRRRDAERTRLSILKTATEEFSRHGFAGARTEVIAKRARCNVRLIYHHYKSKQQLYLATIEEAYAAIRAREAELTLDVNDPVGSLEELLRFTMDYFEENPLFEGLLRAENIIQGRFVRRSKRVPESALHLKTMLKRIIESGERGGTLRPGLDPVRLYVTITALSRFHHANAYSLSALLGEDLRSPAWRGAWRRHAVEMLRAFVAKPAGGRTM